MNIPRQFEYIDVLYSFRDRPEIPKFVTILDEFVHYYSGTKMYYARVEFMGHVFNTPTVEYMTLTEEQLADMLSKRKGERSCDT